MLFNCLFNSSPYIYLKNVTLTLDMDMRVIGIQVCLHTVPVDDIQQPKIHMMKQIVWFVSMWATLMMRAYNIVIGLSFSPFCAFTDSVCLSCYIANGHIIVFSLPSLKPLLDVDYIPFPVVRSVGISLLWNKDCLNSYKENENAG